MKEARVVKDGLTGVISNRCPQCGAGLPPSTGIAVRVTCAYCGTQALLPKRQAAEVFVEPSGGAAQAEPLPAELSGLKRPKAGYPANPTGFFSVVFGIIWVLFSTLFTIIGVALAFQEQQRYDVLQNEGLTVPGTVTTLQIDEDSESTDYDVYYRYPVTVDGRPVTFSGYQDVPEDLYYTLREGQTIEIVYAPSQPEVSKVKAALSPPPVWVFILVILFGLGFDLIGLFMLARTIVSMQEGRRLKYKAQVVHATVFERWTENDPEGGLNYGLAYAFKAPMPDGSLRLVTRGEYNRAVYESVEVGGTLLVRYLPEKPEVNRIDLEQL